jgi:hypothetical protein
MGQPALRSQLGVLVMMCRCTSSSGDRSMRHPVWHVTPSICSDPTPTLLLPTSLARPMPSIAISQTRVKRNVASTSSEEARFGSKSRMRHTAAICGVKVIRNGAALHRGADITARSRHFRFTPDSGHWAKVSIWLSVMNTRPKLEATDGTPMQMSLIDLQNLSIRRGSTSRRNQTQMAWPVAKRRAPRAGSTQGAV